MKTTNNKKAHAFLGAAFVLLIALLFTGCQNSADGNKPAPTPPPAVNKFIVKLENTLGGNVTVTPALPADELVAEGTELAFTAAPLKGYKLAKWELDGTDTGVAGLTYKLKVERAAKVKAVFAEDNPTLITKRTVTLTVPSTGGTVTAFPEIPSDNQVPEGSKIVFTAVPHTGYEIGTWTVTPASALQPNTGTTGSATAAIMVSTATQVKLTFKRNGNFITFGVDGTPENGTLIATVDGIEIHSGDNVEQEKIVTFTATPDEGYAVDKWTLSHGSFEPGSGTVYNKTAKVKVTEDTEIKVSFTTGMCYSVNGIGFLMKDIKAVTDKTIGLDDENDNKPRTVSLSAYLIGETEVTQDLWQTVTGNNPSYLNGDPNDIDKQPASGEVQEKRPVDSVSWYACIAFCNKLSKACNLVPCYTVSGVNFDTLTFDTIPTSRNSDWDDAVCDWSKNGFRLPTEAEWEWAAMGGTSDKWAGTDIKEELKDYAWYGKEYDITHEVKKKKANGYGLYDMCGNVEEWCWDWHTGNLITPAGGQDPTGGGPGFFHFRILRGGSYKYIFGDAAADCTRARRRSADPSSTSLNHTSGLRLVCRPD